MRIGHLAKATGTSVETIRYYEREGILPAADRTASNYRHYSQDDLELLTFVRRARTLGFNMADVRELLSLSDRADKPCENVDRLAQKKLIEVERKISDLTKLRNELGQMVGSCESQRIDECGIVESLGRSYSSGIASEP
jgi:Cu(I)-responsive transcriptional regulator